MIRSAEQLICRLIDKPSDRVMALFHLDGWSPLLSYRSLQVTNVLQRMRSPPFSRTFSLILSVDLCIEGNWRSTGVS